MILLEKSLLVLDEGVIEGRKSFPTSSSTSGWVPSSNFGNMFSVLGASYFRAVFAMKPIQILANNLLYDISQTAIPTDSVDEERLLAPRAWNIKEPDALHLVHRSMLVDLRLHDIPGDALRLPMLGRLDSGRSSSQ